MTATSTAPTRWILPATILGSSLGFIDSSVVNIALPAVQRDFHSALSTMQWIVNGYMLSLASFILIGGASGDRFGRRLVFLVGLSGFSAASLLCAVAPSVGLLVLARLAQGLAAALLTPASLAIVGSAFSGEARGRAIGTWAGAAALTTAFGPPFGGWLVDTVGWRAIFMVNLPIAGLAAWFILRTPADPGRQTDKPLDFTGALLAAVSLGLICFGLIALGKGQKIQGWGSLAATAITIVCFCATERRAQEPMMPLSLFSNRGFAGANGLTVLLYAALTAVMFLLPFVLIKVRGYAAAEAGTAFLPFALIMGAGSRAAGSFGSRFGFRAPLAAGSWTTAFGFVLLGLGSNDGRYWTGVFPGMVVAALGMTMAVAPLTAAVFDSAPPDMGGIASGINNTAARAGGLIAIAALGLAFGDPGNSALAGAALLSAYRLVMFAAAGLASASGIVAILTIRRR